MNRPKIIRYYRVSTVKQGESKLGLESQKAIIHHYYPEFDYEFTEVLSGSIFDRPKLQEAIKLCKQHKGWLIVAKVDRLSRKTEDVLRIWEELDKRIIFCDIPTSPFQAVEKFTLSIFAAIADRERELIAIRTKAALDIKKSKCGEWRTGRYISSMSREKGVQSIKDKASRNENNIRATQIVAEKSTKGYSLQEIAKVLNQNKFRTSTGKEFTAMQVLRIKNKELQTELTF